METIEYSVCEDCLLYVSHSGEEIEDGDTSHIGEAIQRELAGRSGHFNTGVEPTEEDPEGRGGAQRHQARAGRLEAAAHR